MYRGDRSTPLGLPGAPNLLPETLAILSGLKVVQVANMSRLRQLALEIVIVAKIVEKAAAAELASSYAHAIQPGNPATHRIDT
jgi:hypothetical protein